MELCRNGVIDAYEECDGSAPNNQIPCSDNCRSLCGNGILDDALLPIPIIATVLAPGNTAAVPPAGNNPNEVCDPLRPGDTNCNPVTCQIITGPPPVCGDGILDVATEQCDDGNTKDDDSCDNSCNNVIDPNILCGNDLLEDTEECDPSVYSTNCDANCQVTLVGCGDGDLDAGEGCDDSNNLRGDGCNSFCQPEDGFVCRGGLSCSRCGNGIVDSSLGEVCDDANTIDDDGCDNQCQFRIPPYCGNGFINSDEQCDDGNNNPGDGCSVACRIEPEFICIQVGSASKCSLCGNGKANTG